MEKWNSFGWILTNRQFWSGLVDGLAGPIDLFSGRAFRPLRRPRYTAVSLEGAWREVGDLLDRSVQDVRQRIGRFPQ